MTILDIQQAVISSTGTQVIEKVQAELDNGVAVGEILNQGLIAAMDEVGRKFSAGEFFVPEMLRSAQSMKKGLEVLKPLLVNEDTTHKYGTIVIGTVKGDLHDIGKNLVSMMLESAGFDVLDLGVDVEIDKFVELAKQNMADIVALSALLTTTMPAMEVCIGKLKEQCNGTKCIVGGAPVTQGFADTIGADGYAQDAFGAVELARVLTRTR